MVDWSKLKIFVCDSDAHYRKLIVQMLREKNPASVFECNGGCHKTDMLTQVKPDLVVASLRDDDQVALDLVKWLRNPRTTPCPGVPVIFTVAVSSNQALRKCIRSGVDHFVAKPLSPHTLHNRIEQLLEKPLPLTETKDYIGPDRRRLPQEAYDGPERRGTKAENAA